MKSKEEKKIENKVFSLVLDNFSRMNDKSDEKLIYLFGGKVPINIKSGTKLLINLLEKMNKS